MDTTQILNTAYRTGVIKEIPDDPKTKEKLAEKLAEKFQGKTKKSEDDLFYEALINQAVEKGLPVPPEIEGEVPDMPLDLTTVADKEVRFLHGIFNACAARARWLYSIEEAGEAAAKQIADYHEEEYIIRADRKDFGGKAKPMALLKSEAKASDAKITEWRKLEQTHSIAANKYKRLTETYDTNCERLSREWTMRSVELKNQ